MPYKLPPKGRNELKSELRLLPNLQQGLSQNRGQLPLGESGAIYGAVLQSSEKKLAVLPLGIWEVIGRPTGIMQVGRSFRQMGIAIAQGTQTDENGSLALPYLPEGWYVVMSGSAVSEPVEVRVGHETGPIHLAPATLPEADVSQ